jgi:hypothetical protein
VISDHELRNGIKHLCVWRRSAGWETNIEFCVDSDKVENDAVVCCEIRVD